MRKLVTVFVFISLCALGLSAHSQEEAAYGSPDSTVPDAVVGASPAESQQTPSTQVSNKQADAQSNTAQSMSKGDVIDASKLEERIDRALRRLSFEPSLAELEQAALRRADVHPSDTESWPRASRVSAALPQLKVSAEYDIGRDENLDRYQDEPDRWGADTDRGYGVGVSAQWKLDELVFNPDEIRVYDALADRAARRESLLAILVGYYYERRRLQLESLLVPAADVKTALDRRIRISELTSSIDALTGGLLSRKLRSRVSNGR